MITRMQTTVTTNRFSNAHLRNRLAPELFERSALQQQGKVSLKQSPAAMSPLGHLFCGCLGLAGLAAFMGVIHLMVTMPIQQSASWDLYSLMRIFGG